ncbi:hypothetical protein HBI64_006420 [Parastagonospora nodorum]|nr:hypothetical protein HBH51_037310 [Parastagonospora nodorum]KAH4607702.1 hypothetical protein HBH82_081880 [Parastagonospora nodorum]KAH4696443.1 hypothetical protein HBH78_069510 [Parastagonospora nodorum]KAH4709665.1 hypothetical protein HBH67_045860 [Parastagonospora nodorum]KAH4783121.1 hypothetical protein HBH62_111630 [Parastagonospora nodorum]
MDAMGIVLAVNYGEWVANTLARCGALRARNELRWVDICNVFSILCPCPACDQSEGRARKHEQLRVALFASSSNQRCHQSVRNGNKVCVPNAEVMHPHRLVQRTTWAR